LCQNWYGLNAGFNPVVTFPGVPPVTLNWDPVNQLWIAPVTPGALQEWQWVSSEPACSHSFVSGQIFLTQTAIAAGPLLISSDPVDQNTGTWGILFSDNLTTWFYFTVEQLPLNP
jgi:hypothetical protein